MKKMIAITFQRGSLSAKAKENIRADANKSGHGVVFIEYAPNQPMPAIMPIGEVVKEGT
jgi:hypothetical protein